MTRAALGIAQAVVGIVTTVKLVDTAILAGFDLQAPVEDALAHKSIE